MGLLKKIIAALKTQDDGFYAQTPPFDEDGNPVDKREVERFDLHNEFCIFVADHESELDMETAPFLLANLTNISVTGAAFSCVSKTACTPYVPDIEEDIIVSSKIWLLPNIKIDMRSCCQTACDSNSAKTVAEIEHWQPMKAIALWVKTEQFGCVFKEDKEKILELIKSLENQGTSK